MADMRIPEGELVVPAMEEIYAAPGGRISTSELIKKLENRLNPKGEDSEILDNRHDSKFSQKVRNLKSHKKLEKAGLVTHPHRGFEITDRGRRWVESLRRKS